MAKKSKSFNFLIPLLLLVIAIATACMVFVPAGKYVVTILGVEASTNFEVPAFTFGSKDSDGNVILKFNTVAFLGFFLALIAVLVYILIVVLVKKKGAVAVVLPTLAFIAGAVLAFLSVKSYATINYNADSSKNFVMGAGPIIAGVLNCVGALVGVYGTYKALK